MGSRITLHLKALVSEDGQRLRPAALSQAALVHLTALIVLHFFFFI